MNDLTDSDQKESNMSLPMTHNAVAERLLAAPPGPWKAFHVRRGVWAVCAPQPETREVFTNFEWPLIAEGLNESLAQLIANAPSDLAALLGEVKHYEDLLRPVTVCDACLQASCWRGEFMCQDVDDAGTVDLPIVALGALGRESSDWWAAQ